MTRQQELTAMLKDLRLPGMASSFTDLATKAAKDGSNREEL